MSLSLVVAITITVVVIYLLFFGKNRLITFVPESAFTPPPSKTVYKISYANGWQSSPVCVELLVSRIHLGEHFTAFIDSDGLTSLVLPNSSIISIELK